MATMKEVAEKANVSIGTVSFVVNGTHNVSPATRARVEAAMAELDYQPNVLAQGLASRKSKILALALPVGNKGIGVTQMEYVVGASEMAREMGYSLVLWPLVEGIDGELESLVSKGLVDGVLLMEVRDQDPRVDVLVESKVPYVAIGRSGRADEKYVDIDFEATIREGLNHLVELGHTHIAFVNHSQASMDGRYGPTWRASEIVQNLELGNCTIHEYYCDETVEAGRAVVEKVVNEAPAITAFLIMNEEASFGISHEFLDRGFAIPQDYSLLMLVSSRGVANRHRPPMTSVPAPGRELGSYAANMLIAQLNDEHNPIESHLSARQLVMGVSTATAPQR